MRSSLAASALTSTFSEDSIDRAQARIADLQRRLSPSAGTYRHIGTKGEAQGTLPTALLQETFAEVDALLEELRVADERLREQNTALHRAHDQITAERERYAELFEYAPDAYFVTDAAGIVREVNRTAALLFGVRPSYLIGKPLINYVLLEDRSALRQQLLSLQSEDAPAQTAEHVRITPPQGEPFESALRFTVVRDGARRRAGEVRWLLRDTSARMRTEEAYYHLLMDAIEDFGIILLNADMQIVTWNRGAESIFGYTTGEAIGAPLSMLFLPEDRASGVPLQERDQALAAGRVPGERWLMKKDGTSFFASGVLIRLPGNLPGRRFVKVMTDITHRKQAEEALRQSREALEERVRERTAELANVNAALEAEIAERRRAEDKRKQIMRQWVKALEEERRRISRELHDEMGQRLTAFSLGLHALEEAYPNNDRARPLLDQMRVQANDLGREVHRMAVALRPTALDDLGLVSVLQSYVEAWAERTGTEVDIEASGLKQRLPSETETALYRIAQEALNNVAKHASASRVGVMLYRNDGEVVLVVEDDGCGFNAEDAGASARERRSGGLGVVGMRERVSLLGGTLTIESEVGQGTTLLVRVPAPAELLKEDYTMELPDEDAGMDKADMDKADMAKEREYVVRDAGSDGNSDAGSNGDSEER